MNHFLIRCVASAFLTLSGFALAACGGDDPKEETLAHGEAGEVNTTDEINKAATADSGLVVVDYLYEQGRESITGSVMNSSSRGFVNVQVAFRLFDAAGQPVGEAIDSTSEVRPGDLWSFGVPIPPDKAVSRVEPIVVRGTPRNVQGGDVNPGQGGSMPGPSGPPRSEEPTTTPAAPN